METSEIAGLIYGFDAAAVSVSAMFAIYAVFLILGKALKWKSSGKRLFLKAFCIASLVAFALEITVFNYPFYLKYFAGPEVELLGVSPDDPNILITSDGTLAEMITIRDNSNNTVSKGIVFKNLDRKVTSILVYGGYSDNTLSAAMSVSWKDAHNTNTFTKALYKNLPRDNYTAIQPTGKIEELTVMFGANRGINVTNVALNKQIPFNFSGLRLLAVSLLLLAVFSLADKNLRAKAAYCLFELRFNPASIKQNLIYAFSAVLLILLSWICVYTTKYTLSESKVFTQHRLYNEYLVDALIAGRTYIKHESAERLLSAERPYDNEYRIANYKINTEWIWEWAWYKGKYYCYFGVVPAVILYVPYKLVTGDYLSNHAGIFIFAAIATVLLALLWRHCVRRYMPDARFAFYLLSFLALFFTSGLFCVLSFTRHYSIVQAAGYMFAMAGTLLLLKSIDSEKTNRLKLFFACLCFALIAGCRPNMVAASLLVPILLWKRRSWKLLAFVSVPFIIVAVPLMMYNYVRFGSVFDFGIQYTLGFGDGGWQGGPLNPIGRVIKTLIAGAYYLLSVNKYSMLFPYVETAQIIQNNVRNDTFMMGANLGVNAHGGGLINFPIVFCLFYLFRNIAGKDNLERFRLTYAFLIVGAALIAVISWVMGFPSLRYILDFSTYIILASLFCAYCWSDDRRSALPYSARMKVIYVLLAASIFVGLFLFVTGGIIDIRNPVLLRYLEYSLGIIRAF